MKIKALTLIAVTLALAALTGVSWAEEMTPRDHQLKGKALLAEGKYAEADREFQIALDMYKSENIKKAALLKKTEELTKAVLAEKSSWIGAPAAVAVPEKTPGPDTNVSIRKRPELSREAPKEKPAAEDTVKEDVVPVIGIPPIITPSRTSEAPQKMFEYKIMDDDQLQIAVWQNPDLSTDVVVRPDGKVSLPLIGDITTTGKSIPELRAEITKLYGEYVRHPQVYVAIRKFGGKKYIVLGEVTQPGVFRIEGSCSVLEAIADAGGFTSHAVASSVILIRGGLEKPNAERLNLTKALDQGDLTQNIQLASQDIIFVPKKFIANLNYFLTQILEPLRTSGAVATEAAKWYYGGYAPKTVQHMLEQAAQSTVVIQ